VLSTAERLIGRFNLSWWDARLVAACLVGGVERLYTEDFDAYSRIDGLEIINPFH
jgi:predicted nucleic acid-binding protein